MTPRLDDISVGNLSFSRIRRIMLVFSTYRRNLAKANSQKELSVQFSRCSQCHAKNALKCRLSLSICPYKVLLVAKRAEMVLAWEIKE